METNKNKINYLLYYLLVLISSVMLVSCMEDRSPTEPVEITRPELLAIQPSAGTLIFPKNNSIRIVFDEQMNPETFTNRFTLKDYNGNPVEVEISLQDSIVIFTPKSPLQNSTIYYAELRGRIRDANNNSIGIGGEPVLDDTTLLQSAWFYTEGEYSSNGFYPVYLRDRKDGSVRIFNYLDSIITISGGFNAPEGMAVSEDGQYIILSNTGRNEVHIINALSGNSEAGIPVPANPSSVVVFNNYAYVICVNGKSLCKINIASKTLEATYGLTVFPGKLAISPDGTILYTFDQVTRDLCLINSSDGSTIKKVPAVVDRLVTGEISVDKNTGTVYICDSKGVKVKTIDKDGNNLNTVITYPANIEPVEAEINESFIYTAAGNAIYKYNKSNSSLIDTLAFSSKVKSLTIIPSNELLYVSLATSIALVDEKTFTILKEKDLASSGIETILAGSNKR